MVEKNTFCVFGQFVVEWCPFYWGHPFGGNVADLVSRWGLYLFCCRSDRSALDARQRPESLRIIPSALPPKDLQSPSSHGDLAAINYIKEENRILEELLGDAKRSASTGGLMPDTLFVYHNEYLGAHGLVNFAHVV